MALSQINLLSMWDGAMSPSPLPPIAELSWKIKAIAGPPVPPSGSFLHLQSPSFSSSVSYAHLICFLLFSAAATSFLFFPLFVEKARSVAVGGKPLRNGKQTCRVCKHWCAYRWCRANRQESLHCSTQIAAVPLGPGASTRSACTQMGPHTHTHTHTNTD